MKHFTLALTVLAFTLSLCACSSMKDPAPTTRPAATPTTQATRPATNPTLETNIPDPSVDTSMPSMTEHTEMSTGTENTTK